jgi:hypothetical protein
MRQKLAVERFWRLLQQMDERASMLADTLWPAVSEDSTSLLYSHAFLVREFYLQLALHIVCVSILFATTLGPYMSVLQFLLLVSGRNLV